MGFRRSFGGASVLPRWASGTFLPFQQTLASPDPTAARVSSQVSFGIMSTTPIKVLFVTPYWGTPRTGPEVFAKYLFEGFSNDPAIDFHLVAAGSGQGSSRLHLVTPGRGSMALYRDVARAALEWMGRLGGQGILHVNNSNLHSLLLRSPWPVIGQINDYEAIAFRESPVMVLRHRGPRMFASMLRRAWLERRFVGRQAMTLCNSEYTLKRVMEAYRVSNPSNVRVVYKAVDVGIFDRPPGAVGEEGVGDGRPVVTFIGSDYVRKGLDVLMQALPMLGRQVKLVVAGVDEEEFSRRYPGLVNAARAQGSDVAFLGLVDRARIPRLLWGSSLFCMPSRAEALGVALLEALAAGVPSVATEVGGIPEIARHFEQVRLVGPDSPESLAAAMDAVLGSRLKRSSADDVRRVFGKDRMIEAIRECYEELGSRGAPGLGSVEVGVGRRHG